MMRYSFVQWKKSIGLQAVTILFFALVFCLAVAGSTLVSYNTRCYSAFGDYLGAEGLCAYTLDVIYDEIYCYTDSSKFARTLTDAEVLSCYKPWVFGQFANMQTCYTAYDSGIIRAYRPAVQEGKWLDWKVEDSDVVHVVVSDTNGQIRVGDRFEAATHEGSVVPMEVVGVLAPVVKVFGKVTNEPETFNQDDRLLFTQLTKKDRGVVVLMNQQEFLRVGELRQDETMVSTMQGIVMVKYDRGLSEETVAENNQKAMESFLSPDVVTSLDKVAGNFRERLAGRLFTVVPILAAAFIFMLLAVITVNAILFEKQKERYRIYCLCGLSPGRLAGICFLCSAGNILAAAVPVLLGLVYAQQHIGLYDTTLQIGLSEYLALGSMVLLVALVSWLVVWYHVRKLRTGKE